MPTPRITGVHHVKVPVSDLERSRAWYETVLGARVTKEFADDDGVVRGVATALPGSGNNPPVAVALRRNPEVARGIGGFDPLSLSVGDREALAAWKRHFEATGTDHRVLSDYAVAVRDPDDVEIRLFAVSEE